MVFKKNQQSQPIISDDSTITQISAKLKENIWAEGGMSR